MSELKEALINISEEVRTKVIPENIRVGVNMFGVDGDYAGIDTSDATATASDILKDKTAYVNGEKIEGTFEPPSDEGNGVLLDLTGLTKGTIRNFLKTVKLNIDNIKTADDMFYQCDNLESVEIHSTSTLFQMNRMFQYCTNLKHINLFDTSGLGQNGIYYAFGSCPNLSDESLNNIMQMCINNKNAAYNKDLKSVGLSSAQATTCQGLSNYQAFLDAGWTTGY